MAANQKPTIKTVANRAGVAISTVSRYFNGHYVSQPVRLRLAQIIEELGYTRSTTARNLSLGLKGCIGVVVDSTEDPWFTQLLMGIEEELSTRDTSLMLSSLELRGVYDPAIVLKWIGDCRVDGLIIAKSQRRERPLIQTAIEANLPVVMVVPFESFDKTQVVGCDNDGAGIAVANHLAALGHTHVAFAGGPQHSVDTRHRLRGLREGLRRHSITLEERWVSYCGSYEAEAGIQFAQAFFKSPFDVTALVMGNDALALGFMRVAQQRGIHIPKELSLVGFDDIPEGALLWPGLTTVAQPMREMGRYACRSLFERIATPGVLQTIEYPMTLVVRESTGPAPAEKRKPKGQA